LDYNVDYFLNTRVTGNGFSEDLGNLCLAPVRVLFEGRSVYKIDKTYITNIPAVRRQAHVVARVIVTAVKIIILIPFTPLLPLGVALKVVALISSSTRENHRKVIESYKNSSEKDNLMLGSDGWVRILGGKEDFSSNFLTLTSSEQRDFFSALSSLTMNPQELNFFDCDRSFIEKFCCSYNVSFIDKFCCSYKDGAALLAKVKKISIRPEATQGYKSTVESLFSKACLLTEMNIEGDLLKDKDFLEKNQKNLGKIPNVDWSQVNISSLKGLIDIVEGTPTMSEANRLKLFASYWKSSLANGSDPTLDFSVIYTKPKQFYNVRNIELLISQCKGLKKVSIPMDFTLVHVEAIKKSCPTLREINICYSNSMISDFQIDAFAKRNPTIRISGKRPHAPVRVGFDADDHTIYSMQDIEKIFKKYPLLTKDNKRALFAKLWKGSNKYNTFSGSKMDFSILYVSLEQSDLELFAQECKGIKKMKTNNLMTPSQITTFLKNLPKPSTLEKLEFDYNSKKIQEIHLEDFMEACPGIKELNLWGCCGIPDESQALKDFCKKYPAVEIKGKLFGGSSNSSKPKDPPGPSTNNSRPTGPSKPAPQSREKTTPSKTEYIEPKNKVVDFDELIRHLENNENLTKSEILGLFKQALQNLRVLPSETLILNLDLGLVGPCYFKDLKIFSIQNLGLLSEAFSTVHTLKINRYMSKGQFEAVCRCCKKPKKLDLKDCSEIGYKDISEVLERFKGSDLIVELEGVQKITEQDVSKLKGKFPLMTFKYPSEEMKVSEKEGIRYVGFTRSGNLTLDAPTCQRLKRTFLTELGLTEVEADRTAFTKVGSIARDKIITSHPDKKGDTKESNERYCEAVICHEVTTCC
jgi:hypothetical protein